MPSYERNAGEPEKVTYDTTEEMGSPSFIYAPDGPDWVRTPPELGSRKLYIGRRFFEPFNACPNCKAPDVAIKIFFFKESDLMCLETLNCCKQFCWAKRP